VVIDPIVAEQAATLQNLVELYAHDFSEYVPVELKPNGRFDLGVDERWWTADDHFAFFIRARGHLAGFALVRRGSRFDGGPDVMDMAEFFVVRGARRRGVGVGAAHALFEAFPGAWEIRVRPANVGATRFWAGAVEAWVGRPTASVRRSTQDVDWDVFHIAASEA